MQAFTWSHEKVTSTMAVSKIQKGYRRAHMLNTGQEAELELKPRSSMSQAMAFC